MGPVEINAFLSHLAVDANVAASTQNQALSAILFLYKAVLKKDIGALGEVVRAKRPQRLPVCLTVTETESILANLSGVHKLMALLLYGAGMRIIEVIRLRVKDIDFGDKAIMVRDGKGAKDRAVPLPQNTVEALKGQIAKVRLLHEQDLRDGYPHNPGVARPQRRFHHDDLHPSHEDRPPGRCESRRPHPSRHRRPDRARD
jgi:site-specific recombinase XerD